MRTAHIAVLLVCPAVTAGLAACEGKQEPSPVVGTESAQSENIFLAVAADGSMTANGVEIDSDAFEAALEFGKTCHEVSVSAESDAEYARVARAMTLAQKLGLCKLGVIAEDD